LWVSLLAILTTALPAYAQATRTWVSGVGDDVNPCSRTAPCKTFAGAISKTATAGYIDVLDSANYGAVSITKSITIDGRGFLANIGTSGTTGITVNVAGGIVALRNLTIEGWPGTTGINVVNVGSLHVEHVQITNFQTFGINFNPSGANAKLFMDDVTVANTTNGAGIYVRNSRAMMTRVFVTNSQSGIVSGAGGASFIKDSVVTSCGMGFAAAYSSTAVVDVQDSLSADNDWGIVSGTGATARVGNTTVVDNHYYGLYNDGTSFIVSMGNNRFFGNTTDGTFTSTVAIR